MKQEDVIRTIHIVYILFIILAPYQNNENLLKVHQLIIPFMILHWYTNDGCVLTHIEQKLRGIKKDQTFMGQLVGRIYNISDEELRVVLTFLTIYLWLQTTKKLQGKSVLQDIKHMIKIFS